MDLERWTDIETIDCLSVGVRVAAALRMTGLRNPLPGPEHTDVYGSLTHCTGFLKCGLRLPATPEEMMLSRCLVLDALRTKLGDLPRPQCVAVGD